MSSFPLVGNKLFSYTLAVGLSILCTNNIHVHVDEGITTCIEHTMQL